MLPSFIVKDEGDKRHEKYKLGKALYDGDHYEVFNLDEQEAKFNAYEYICFGIIKQAIDTKVDLIWHEKPRITFSNNQLQKEFDQLRIDLGLDELFADFTKNLYLNGDSVLKIGIDENLQTATDDFKLSIYNINPTNWIPEYFDENPTKYPKSQTFKLEKEVKDNSGKELYEAYLLETHFAGRIEWTAYQENEDDKYIQVDPLTDWCEELANVLASRDTDTTNLVITFQSRCDLPLLQFLRNKIGYENFYGKSDIDLPVLSKINALNNYSNLADTVIVSNVFPKILAGEGLQKLMSRIVEEMTSATNKNQNLIPNTFLETPKLQFANARTYLQTEMWKNFVSESRVIPNQGQSETKYLQNDFDLEQLRKQHEIFFKSVMTELGISEVFYNPSLTTGATSGVAYKRLMSMTLNEIEHTKRNLEPFLKKVIYTLLQLGNNNALVVNKAEYPEIQFFDGVINDETEDLNNLVLKVQNNLIPLKEAVMTANDISEEQIDSYMNEIEVEKQVDNQANLANTDISNQGGYEQNSNNNGG